MESIYCTFFSINKEDIIQGNMSNTHFSDCVEKFYKDMCQAWTEINYKEQKNVEEICNQRQQ